MAQTGELTESKYTTMIVNPNVSWVWNQGAELVTNGDDHVGTIVYTVADTPDDWTESEGGNAAITEDAEGIDLLADTGADPAIISQVIDIDPAKTYIFKAALETCDVGTTAFMLGQLPADVAVAGSMGMLFSGPGSAMRIGQLDQFGASTTVSVHAHESAASHSVMTTCSVREALTTWYPGGRRVNSIEFHPGANADVCIFRDGWTTYVAQGDSYDPRCFSVYEAADLITVNDPKYFHGQRIQLVLDYENSTISDGAIGIM
jgi:hypothetical protein